MKNKRKKYAKILMTFLITCIIGLSNIYYVLYCNEKKINLSEDQVNDLAWWPFKKNTTKAAGNANKPVGGSAAAAKNTTAKTTNRKYGGSVAAGASPNKTNTTRFTRDVGFVISPIRPNKTAATVPTTKRPKTTGNTGGNSGGSGKKNTTTTAKKIVAVKKSGEVDGGTINNNGAIDSVNITINNGKIERRGAGSNVAASCNNRTACTITLDAKVTNSEDADKVVWYKDGKLTNIRGAHAETMFDASSSTTYTACIQGKTCPGDVQSPNLGNPYSPSGGGNSGSGDKGTTKTTTTKKETDNYPNKVDKEVFAKGEGEGGESIQCGDKLYIAACSNDADPICQVTKINGKDVKNTFIMKSNYTENEAETGCYQNATRYVKKDSSYYTDSDLTKGKKTFPCGEQVTLKKTMDLVCNNKSCEVEYKGSTIYLEKDALITYKPTCSNDSTGTCTSSEKQNNIIGDVTIKLCKNDDTSEKRNEIVTCAQDYKLYYKLAPDGDYCKESNDSTCYREYIYSCVYGKAPGISASAGIIGSNGLGLINITGYDYGNVGLKGYFLSAGVPPTESSSWSKFDINNKASESQPAGTYFVWAMNNKNIMSNSVLVKVYDADLSTTMNAFDIIDDNTNEVLTMNQLDNKVANVDQIVDAKYALLSNHLLADSNGTGFDKLTTAYEITTTSNKIALYATLTSTDARYIDGYEPRTVDLDYGENIVIIGILNKNGKRRTYTFIVNRVDDRQNDNTLSNIKLSKGKIDFDPYVTNYDVEISKNTKKVSINAELNSETAGFVVGYEPRTIDITEDKQSAVIKVMSDAGNIRSYVITFIKKDYVDEQSNSAYLSSITVPGTQLSFDRDIYNYTVTVPYETDHIPVYAFAESENAEVTISDSSFLVVGTNQIEIEVKNGKNTKIYNLYIIRKEYGLDISNSTRLGMLSIKGYDINFDPNVLDYTVKIKREKTLMIAATPESNRADIYMYGNNDLTGFSTVRVKVIAENGLTQVYSIDIKKDAYNKKLEIIVASVGCLIIVISGIIIIATRKKNKKKEYMEG